MAKPLGQVAEGQIVKLNESGKPVEFYVAKHDYESGLNGPGRTLLVRKDCYDKRQWHSSNVNAYSSSSIDAWLNNDYKNMLYYSIRMVIGTTKFYYTPGNGNTTMGTLDRAVFLLSAYELGKSESWFNKEGTTLPNATNYQIAKLNGSAVIQWTRSPRTDDASRAFCLNTSGGVGSLNCAGTLGSRPAFTLPSNLYVWGDGTVSTESGPTPSTIHTPTISIQGQPITVSWSSVSGADSYILQRNADNGGWTQVYAGPLTTFTDTAGTWSTVQYQVCGVFGGGNGAFAVSPTIQVLPASALAIGGTDGDLGALTSDVPYSVATDTGKNVTVDIAVNGVNVFHRADATTYTGTLSVLDLPTGMGSIVIAASVQADSGMVTAERKWTYTKPAQPFPASGGVAALTKDGKPLFPQTLAECVRTIGGPWGGDLGKALEKLARAATFSRDRMAKYTEVKVDLSKAKAGDIVNLPENGVMVPFYVASLDYEPTLNSGIGTRVLLVRKDVYQNGQWNSTNVTTYAGSTIDNWFNNTYKPRLDSSVLAEIGETTFPYTPGNGDNTVTTLAKAVFSLSLTELGEVETWANVEGTALQIANQLKIAYQKNYARVQHTRSPYTPTSTTASWTLDATGTPDEVICDTYVGFYRPCFTLPATFQSTYYVDQNGVVHPSQEYINGGDFYDLWGEVIPTVKIATGSYVGTGTYGISNKNTLTFPFEPKVVFIGYGDTEAVTIRGSFCFVRGAYTAGSTVSSSSSYTVLLEWDGNTVSWYSGTNQGVQLNATGKTYYYVAIG